MNEKESYLKNLNCRIERLQKLVIGIKNLLEFPEPVVHPRGSLNTKETSSLPLSRHEFTGHTKPPKFAKLKISGEMWQQFGDQGMDSLLSADLASLFIETSENDHHGNIDNCRRYRLRKLTSDVDVTERQHTVGEGERREASLSRRRSIEVLKIFGDSSSSENQQVRKPLVCT